MVHLLFRDAITLALIVFLCMVFLMLPHLNPKAVTEEGIEVPGSVVATITWPEGNDDVDLWVTGPGEVHPVGFSNKGGVLWNLLRDDLGHWPDYLSLNFENAFTRGVPPGAYRVNVQCYRCSGFPMEVVLEVVMRKAGGGSITKIGSSTITLYENHQEKTGLAFELAADGNVVPGSINTLFEPLRNAR